MIVECRAPAPVVTATFLAAAAMGARRVNRSDHLFRDGRKFRVR